MTLQHRLCSVFCPSAQLAADAGRCSTQVQSCDGLVLVETILPKYSQTPLQVNIIRYIPGLSTKAIYTVCTSTVYECTIYSCTWGGVLVGQCNMDSRMFCNPMYCTALLCMMQQTGLAPHTHYVHWVCGQQYGALSTPQRLPLEELEHWRR